MDILFSAFIFAITTTLLRSAGVANRWAFALGAFAGLVVFIVAPHTQPYAAQVF